MTIIYTPPAAGSLTANATVIVSAALTGATTQTSALALTVPAVAGLAWTTRPVAASIGNLTGVDFADGHYVAVSDTGRRAREHRRRHVVAASRCSRRTVPTDHFKAYAITHIGSTYVAVGAISSAPYTTSTGAVGLEHRRHDLDDGHAARRRARRCTA